MRVLHLAAGNRWTGAAAPAFAETEALRLQGVEAHYAYVGGYKLQEKIGHLPFAHASIEKSQSPLAFFRTVQVLKRFIRDHAIDIVHAHLTHDHWLARMAAPRGVILARTFHSRRVLRTDLVSRNLIANTQLLFVINDEFRSVFSGRDAVFTPPPVDHRQFSPGETPVRSMYGIDAGIPLLTVIGKLAPDRGFEDALQTFAAVRRDLATAKLMVIGHGPHRPLLEQLARSLAITDSVVWAGYHEHDLTEHYRAADALLFTAKGSDEGHRAVLEAMACGLPALSFPIEGVAALAGDLAPRVVAPSANPDDLAWLAVAALTAADGLGTASAARSQQFGYEAAAARLIEAYSAALAGK